MINDLQMIVQDIYLTGIHKQKGKWELKNHMTHVYLILKPDVELHLPGENSNLFYFSLSCHSVLPSI